MPPQAQGEVGGVKAYARHRRARSLTGGSPAAVRKADTRGDVVWVAPGVIDFAATDAAWASDSLQEAWSTGGGPEPRQAGEPFPPLDAAAPAFVVPRQQDAASNRLKESRANREEVEAQRKLRMLQVEEGDLMRVAEGTALMLEVVGRVCDRMDAVPDVVTEDLVAMIAEWLERAAKGEVVEVDTAAIYATISDAVRSARDGAAATVQELRASVLAEATP